MIVGRFAWGGPVNPIGEKMSAPAASVTAHHSLSPAVPCGASVEQERAAMRQIQENHAAKWRGIGYNFCITQSGNIYEGRGWDRIGAHTGTRAGNATSVGVCFLIDGREDAPSAAAMDAFTALRKIGVVGGHLARNHGLRLHRDWKATECPGDVAAAAIRGHEEPTDGHPLLRRGDRGPAVKRLQVALVVRAVMTAEQMRTGVGVFGPLTEAAVREFQRQRGLAVDGLVGPLTWRELDNTL